MMDVETATAMRGSMIDGQRRNIQDVMSAWGREYAVVAADATACAGIAVIADLCGRRAAVQHAYMLADSIPLPEAEMVQSYRGERRVAFWRAFHGMLERGAYAMAGLMVGAWFTLSMHLVH